MKTGKKQKSTILPEAAFVFPWGRSRITGLLVLWYARFVLRLNPGRPFTSTKSARRDSQNCRNEFRRCLGRTAIKGERRDCSAENERGEDKVTDLERFYERVDQDARSIYELDPDRFQCWSGCHECCIDGLSVFEIEAKNIAHHYRDLLLHGNPHPRGACAFLDESGQCRIYDQRPYVCRTQGLPLRWIEDLPEGGTVEMRDICPLNDKGRPLETLDPGECWSVGPFEEELARLQIAYERKTHHRILLRELFVNGNTS